MTFVLKIINFYYSREYKSDKHNDNKYENSKRIRKS